MLSPGRSVLAGACGLLLPGRSGLAGACGLLSPGWSVLAGACGVPSPGWSVLARGLRVARGAAAGVESPSQLVERKVAGPTGAVAYLS